MVHKPSRGSIIADSTRKGPRQVNGRASRPPARMRGLSPDAEHQHCRMRPVSWPLDATQFGHCTARVQQGPGMLLGLARHYCQFIECEQQFC